MTRKEEIEKASRARHLEKYNQEGFCPDFTDGAQWADKTMIEKAVKWLGENAQNYTYDDYGIMAFIRNKQLKEDFKQAMEE